MRGSGAIFECLVNSCWSCFKWGLVLSLIGGLVLVPYLYNRVDEEIRVQVEAKLAGHYKDLSVSVRSAKLVEGEGGGIEIRGLVIREPGPGVPLELAYIDELFLACNTDLANFVQGQPQIDRIYVRRPRIRFTHRGQGTWSGRGLYPLPKLSENPAPITVENGLVEICDPAKTPGSVFTLRDLNLRAWHDHAAKPQTPDGLVVAAPPQRTMHLQGGFTGDYMRQVELTAHLLPSAGKWSVDGVLKGLDFSPEFAAALPADLSDKIAPATSLRAESQVDFHVSQDPAVAPALQFDVTALVHRGRLDDSRLPFPFTDIQSEVRATHAGFEVKHLSAKNGQTTLKLSCRKQGYDPAGPMEVTMQSRNLTLDEHLFEFLPEPLKGVYHKFYPAGEVNVDAQLTFDGKKWQPDDVKVECLNTSFMYYKNPYRLERGRGQLNVKQDHLTLDVTAFSGPDAVRVTGDLHHPGPDFIGEIVCEAKSLPLDDKLFGAMEKSHADVMRSLNPRGAVGGMLRIRRDDGLDKQLHKSFLGKFQRCSLRYAKFRYPVENIVGDFECVDGEWKFANLQGNNDIGVVTCRGDFRNTSQGGELTLNFDADNIALEEELREALDPKGQRLWSQLRPRGAFDLRNCAVKYLTRAKKLSLEFRLFPRPESTILPAAFPLEMKLVAGSVFVKDGAVTIEGMRAEHGRTRLSTEGTSSCNDAGDWELRLANLWIERLNADRDFIAALPERLRKTAVQLNPSGSLGLRGGLNFNGSAAPGTPVQASWDLSLDFNQADFDVGVPLRDVRGGVRLIGAFDGQTPRCTGDVRIDSLMYRDFQFTEVEGPLWMDDKKVLLGSWAEATSPGQPPRKMRAKAYGGQISADASIEMGALPRYRLIASLSNGELARFTRETVAGRQQLRGKVFGNIDLTGVGAGLHSLNGKGSVQLREADVYELPLMVALLKILNLRPVDTTGFTDCRADYQIRGNHIYFEKLAFEGDAVTLGGTGEMNFETDINLTLQSTVGRGELKIPFIGEMVKGASQQIMLLHVTGTLDNPVVKPEALPGFNRAIKDIEAGLQSKE